MTTLGQLVRHRRKQLQLTLDRLAPIVQCSKAYLSAIENDRLDNPPSTELLLRLESALQLADGELRELADWARTPKPIRERLHQLDVASDATRELARTLLSIAGKAHDSKKKAGKDLDALYASGQLQRLIDAATGNVAATPAVRARVPIINKVAAGYPADFTDLDYPARVADDFAAVPDLADPDAFAARVCGASMQPDYREGDIIVFSPATDPRSGSDCFVRILPDHQTTFKRVYFESEQRIRLQPLNPAFAPATYERTEIAGLYPAIMKIQKIG